MTLVFLDTEFTDVLLPQLLSLGLVGLDGREHYVELDLALEEGRQRTRRATRFVREVVLPQWGRYAAGADSLSGMQRKTSQWLRDIARAGRVEVAYDYVSDFQLLADLMRQAEEQVPGGGLKLVPINVSYLHSIDGLERVRDAELHAQAVRGLQRHHALADACALRTMYLAVHTELGRSLPGKQF